MVEDKRAKLAEAKRETGAGGKATGEGQPQPEKELKDGAPMEKVEDDDDDERADDSTEEDSQEESDGSEDGLCPAVRVAARRAGISFVCGCSVCALCFGRSAVRQTELLRV